MATTLKTGGTKCWWGCGATGTSYIPGGWECNLKNSSEVSYKAL